MGEFPWFHRPPHDSKGAEASENLFIVEYIKINGGKITEAAVKDQSLWWMGF